jgi:hypothetical protein
VYERFAREQKPPDPRCSRCPIRRSRQQAGGIHIQVIDTRQAFERDQGG